MAVNIPITSKPRIVIIGAGFAGLALAKGLKHFDGQIVLIDKNNYHTFQPLLYQVATAGLEPDSIAYPVREVFRRQKNFLFRMAEVQQINPSENCVTTSIGPIQYDYLVISTGSQSNFFGMKDVEAHSLDMKGIPEAVELRNIILENFEKALLTTQPEERDRLMTFVIIGGGPTGVELAGALGELKKVVLPYDHPELNFKKMQIHLVDMDKRLLPTMSEDASKSAEKFLTEHDVNVTLNARVQTYDGKQVTLSNGSVLPTFNVIWAAGVKGATVPGLKDEAYSSGRYRTDVYSRVQGYQNIFAIGDVAAVITDKNPKGDPMLAPVAIQEAKVLAGNLKKIVRGDNSLRPFAYRNLGVMATVGRHHAVADLFFGQFQGAIAWFMWAILHLITLVGFRNRLVAFVNWTWSYLTYDRSSIRLIIRTPRKEDAGHA